MNRWWELDPTRLDREVEALKQAGGRVRVNVGKYAPQQMVLEVDWPCEGERLVLDVVFPDLYPYFRPEVIAPSLHLDRHQNRFNYMVCLLAGGTHGWDCNRLVADYLVAQLPLAIRSGTRDADPAALEGIEGIHADPVSAQFPYLPSSFVLVDSDWNIPDDVRFGTMKVSYETGAFHGGAIHEFRGAVKSIEDEHRTSIAEWQGAFPQRFGQTLIARWVRSDEPIIESNPGLFIEKLAALEPKIRQLQFDALDPQTHIGLVGLLFREEIQYRQPGPSWMFVLVERIRRRQQRLVQARQAERGGPQQSPETLAFIRAFRGGPGDYGARTPAVAALRGKKVAVFGAGALGAPVAIDLARNRTQEIRLMDHDFVEPGPTVRWPLGASAYGHAKQWAIAAFIAANFPWTRVEPYPDMVGWLRPSDHMSEPQDDRVERMLDGVDIIFDATVEFGVHHFLSDMARARTIPYVYAFGTPGMRGGLVARIRADGPCWRCLQYALYPPGGARPAITPPPADETDAVRPPGCADQTFTGASFEIGEVGLEAVRTIVSTLSGEAGGYANAPKDVATLALRDDEGRRILPSWTAHDIPRRENCPWCGRAAAPPI